MEIILEKKDNVNAELKVNILESDYSPSYKKKLKEYAKKVQLKGFRPGLVPIALVEKMHGKSFLVEEINTIVSDAINNYIKENKLSIIGDPIPEEKSMQAINWDANKDFNLVYTLGLTPNFNLELSEKVQITSYKISYTDKILKETTENLRKQFSVYEDTTISSEDDIIYADAKDENGKEYKAIIPQYRVSESEKASFIGLELGQTIIKDVRASYADDATIAHIFAIDKKESPFLNGNITYTITRISQQKLAEINQEFYAKVFKGATIENHEEFENKLKENIEKSYQMESRNALFNDIYDYYTQNTKIELPSEFLKNWLYYKNNGKFTFDQIDSQYKSFEIGFIWDLIKTKVAVENKLTVEADEIMERATFMVLSQFGISASSLDEEMKKMILSMADNFVKKDNGKEYRKIFEQLHTEKVINLISSKIKLKEENIDIEKFTEIQKSYSK